MQILNVIVRLGGLLTNTVPKIGVTPAEILCLQAIHGSDAVVDIRPTGEEQRRDSDEFARLAAIYDRQAGDFDDQPNTEREGIMARLFPGAVKRLPQTLEEIGIGPDAAAAEPAPAPAPGIPDAPAEELADADETDASAGAGGDADATAANGGGEQSETAAE